MRTRNQPKTAVLGINAPKLVISVLGGVEPGSVVMQGKTISGTVMLREIMATRKTLLDFLNCPDKPNDAAKHFTELHGPLTCRGGEFSFDIKDWRNAQRRLQAEWRQMCADDFLGESLAEMPRSFSLGSGHGLTFFRGQAHLRARNLLEFLQLELALLDPSYLRICPNPDCPRPFFIKTKKDKKGTTSYCERLACKQWGKDKKNPALYCSLRSAA